MVSYPVNRRIAERQPIKRHRSHYRLRVTLREFLQESVFECLTQVGAMGVPSSRKKGPHIAHAQKAIERIVRASGVSFRGHDLRRTAASLMVGAGVSRLVVSKILNHVETGVTAVYDRHGYDLEKRAALDFWGKRVDQIIGGKRSKVLAFVPRG